MINYKPISFKLEKRECGIVLLDGENVVTIFETENMDSVLGWFNRNIQNANVEVVYGG